MTTALLCMSWFAFAAVCSVQSQKKQREDPGVVIRPWFDTKNADAVFQQFTNWYNRTYSDEAEKQARFEIFKQNLDRINTLHLLSDNFHADYGVTEYMDMTTEEFTTKVTGLRTVFRSDNTKPCEYLQDTDIVDRDVPESYDWRKYGAVTPVKVQGICGSGYAFGLIGNIESQYYFKTGMLLSLSEQQILDCVESNSGCDGGSMDIAIQSLINNGGCQSEADYPYQGTGETCNFDANKVKVKIRNCRSYNLTSQEKLKQLLYQTGPIAIGMQGLSLQFYFGKIIPDENCNGDINHAALLVGYGSDYGVPFWLVKNSWGKRFGEKGYIKLERGKDAFSCGIFNDHMTTVVL